MPCPTYDHTDALNSPMMTFSDFARDVLGVELTRWQESVLEAIERNQARAREELRQWKEANPHTRIGY